MDNRNTGNNSSSDARINDQIRGYREARIIGHDGKQLGVLGVKEAISIARDMDLDLVEVNKDSNPPVCKIMNYGKYKFEQQKKNKNQQKASGMKEIKFRPNTGDGDYNTKVKKIIDLISDGYKVKILVQLRGREVIHYEVGSSLLNDICNDLSGFCTVDSRSSDEKSMYVVVTPSRKK